MLVSWELFRCCPTFGFSLLMLKFGSLDLSTRSSAWFWINPRSSGLFLELIKANSLLSPSTMTVGLIGLRAHELVYFLWEKRALKYLLRIWEIPCLWKSYFEVTQVLEHIRPTPSRLTTLWITLSSRNPGNDPGTGRHQSCPEMELILDIRTLIVDHRYPDSFQRYEEMLWKLTILAISFASG